MARLLAGLALAGALALGLWIWAGTERRTPEIAPPVHPARRAGTAQQAAELAPVDSVAPVSSDDTPRESAAPSRREELAQGEVPVSDGDLWVRVVDPKGEPQPGVELRLILPVEPEAEAGLAPTTNARGEAVFEGARARIERSGQPWRLRHQVPHEEPPELLLTSTVLRSSPVVSVQPWGGSVEVIVRELDGSHAPDGSFVELSLVTDEEAVDPMLATERLSWPGELRRGRVHFRHVELGRTFGAKARRPGSDVHSRTSGPGPVVIGETSELEVVLGTEHAILAYRAVSELGEPFRSTELELEHTKIWGYADRKQTITDEQGIFTFDVEQGWIFGQGTVIVTHVPPGAEPLRGRLELAQVDSPGRHACGDVVLSPEPVLVAGHVEDRLGNPVAGAKVVADTGRFGKAPLERSGARFGGQSLETESLFAGRFEIRGVLPSDEIYLQSAYGATLSQSISVEPGTLDAVLVLERRWTVTGRVLLDAGFDLGLLRLTLVEAEVEEPRRFGLVSNDSDGEGQAFQFAEAPSGLYDVELRLGDTLLESIRIPVEDNVDLGDIDLRGRLHAHEIVLLGNPDSGKPEGEIAWRPSATDEEWNDVRIEQEATPLVTTASPIDVWVRVRGHRFVLLEGVSGKREVVLEAPLRVRLELLTDGELPRFPHVFDPDLMLDDVHVGFPEGSEYFTDESRSVVFLVSRPGTLTVKWHLERRMDNGAVGGHVLSDQEQTIEVLDVAGEQVFQLRVEGEALTRLSTNPPW